MKNSIEFFFFNQANQQSQPDSEQSTQLESDQAPGNLAKLFENLNYTLELSSNESTTFNKVYTGDANEITLKDLRPNTKYYLRVFASLTSKCRGDYTNAVCFQTLMCQPDQPAPPKLTGTKKRNKCSNFILEYQEVASNRFGPFLEFFSFLWKKVTFFSDRGIFLTKNSLRNSIFWEKRTSIINSFSVI